MKSIILNILTLSAILLLSAGCSGKSEDAAKPKRMEYAVSNADLPFPKQVADSLSGLYGYLVAYDQLCRIDTMSTPFDKEAYTEGVEMIIANPASSAGYTQGAQSAMSILGQIKELKAKGVKVNIPLLIKGLHEGLYTDSVTPDQVSAASTDYNRLLVRALGI
ncbi:MAG: hypothetical protein K2J17_08450 [Paramuribaculum sp.]|nr:hypothetical protein [Paramuribaculum sp.]MDE6783735.1 hypothetical protein [Paramuribaculum sp.]